MDRGAWWATVYRVAKSWTPPKQLSMHARVKVKVAQSCLTLCNLMDCSLPISFVHRILQARILEWVAMTSSRGLS